MFACRIEQFAGCSAWINAGIATEGLGASVFGGYGTPIDRSVARCTPENDVGESPQNTSTPSVLPSHPMTIG